LRQHRAAGPQRAKTPRNSLKSYCVASTVPDLLNGWAMRVRKGGTTFSCAEPTNGVVRDACDVIVQRNGESEWIAISRQAAITGETLILDVDEDGQPQRLAMCVIESRRFVLDGDTRHWIRLQATDLPPILFEQQIRRG